ncbi:unnamed protein product, partial [Owenia fusiformis]
GIFMQLMFSLKIFRLLHFFSISRKISRTSRTEVKQKMEDKRPQFGNRFLTESNNVFEHNAWDNVVWDEEQEKEALEKVKANSINLVSQEMFEKYENEAGDYWDSFYTIHQNRFFKDRHWLFTEFPELAPPTLTDAMEASNIDEDSSESNSTILTAKETVLKIGDTTNTNDDKEKTKFSLNTAREINNEPKSDSAQIDKASSSLANDLKTKEPEVCYEEGSNDTITGDKGEGDVYPGEKAHMRILEVGCGVGNTVFPVLQTNNDPGVFVYCCDFSNTAIDIVKEHADYDPERCHAFYCDITDMSAPLPFPENSLDVIVMIFVLSATHPHKMQEAMNRLARHLKPGGKIMFRDYGRYDMAQLRFKNGKCLSDNFYVRGDGTRVYFFTQEELRDLFTKAGLVEEQNLIDRRLQVNRGRQIKMYRVWVQCKYRKPLT